VGVAALWRSTPHRVSTPRQPPQAAGRAQDAAHEERPAAERGGSCTRAAARNRRPRHRARTRARPSPQPPPLGAGASGPSGVTLKLEEEEEEEEQEEEEQEEVEERPQRDEAAPGPARMPASRPRAAHSAAPAPAPHHEVPAAWGAGVSGVTLVKEEEEAETLGQQRDRLALALTHGPVRVDSHIKVEDSTSGEDTDGDRVGEEEATGGMGGDGEEEEGPGGGEGGLVLLAGEAHVPGRDGDRGGAPCRSTPAERAAKRGRGAVAAGDDIPDAPAPKRQNGGAKAGKSGRHGVYERTGADIRKDTPWLKWRAQLSLPSHDMLDLGLFATADDAARAYDAEVRRRGWAHVKPLNFPQPEEQAAYAQAGKRCEERGLPLTLAPDPPAVAQNAAAAQGAAGQPPAKLSVQKPGKSGFFGVRAQKNKNKATQWMAAVAVPGANTTYVVGYFAIKVEAARAYDAEVRRRGWTLVKRLNFPDPADGGAQPPAAVGAGEAPGPM